MEPRDVARAIACFEQSDDMTFLRDVLRAIRPRAEATARRFEQQGRAVPPPLELEPADEPATPKQAMATVRAVKEFEALQAMARAAGRRAEELAAGRE
jgi:hypothetical protein